MRSQPTNPLFPCAVSQLQPVFPDACQCSDAEAPIRGFGPDTLPPRRDFAACNRHIIAAALAAAITRFAFRPYRGASRSAACLWDGEASAGCGLAKPASEDVQQGGPDGGPHGAEMASTATSKEPASRAQPVQPVQPVQQGWGGGEVKPLNAVTQERLLLWG
ncbi:hypothetical protein ECA2124 [Pectobacterium atrosepticum SCRI1043]|uniref:Uncharacterized protein n=1 Tax=Pectobacterium atrosepticum (strain SCRI 1043 / ATCC BAA-672) TaxID=218491 RepID=Q6D5B6_PECAS|nr:hypothetical protein [Pectobacterium atrosepticum]CAG75026.1 hypothetical protein ECA2124 [Pectobacterium atrosepticum SCRI1043]